MWKLFVNLFFLVGVFYNSMACPPFGVSMDLENYEVKSITLSCEIDALTSDDELRSRVRREYMSKIGGSLYTDESVIDRLSLSKVQAQYRNLLSYEYDRASNVVSFKFNLNGYIEILGINDDKLTDRFDKGAIPFLFDYVFTFEMQSKTSADVISHKLIFGRFMGANPMPNDCSSETFSHLKPKNHSGQMTLTDRKSKGDFCVNKGFC